MLNMKSRMTGASVLAFRSMRPLDPTDCLLLEALIADPKATTVALADRLGLSRNTVQARQTRLEAAGVFLSFDRRVSSSAIGYPLTAFITVHVKQRKLGPIVAELAQIPEIVQAHGLSGASDLLLQAVCSDAENLFEVNGRVLACDGVKRTETALDIGELIPYRISPLLAKRVGSLRRALDAAG